MITETPFEILPESEQNRLLSRLSIQLRPMLGEIGEVLVRESSEGKKPGFIGILFGHVDEQAILFAEYVDETSRVDWRKTHKSVGTHIFGATEEYVAAIIAAGRKNATGDLAASDGLLLSSFDGNIRAIFRGCYGEAVDDPDFKIKLLGKPLKKSDGGEILSMLYFAVKDGDEFQPAKDLISQLAKLVEQLVRNALGLAAIGDQELRSVVGYLTNRLPQSFNDYVAPQTLAAIYAYVREVVPLPLSNPEMPEVEPRDAERAEELKSIHSAKHIRVVRAVGGSLKGASVYSLKITPCAMDDESSTSYPAIAKFSTISEARDEADGLRRMQRYYSHIGKMLAPPLEVYLLKGIDGEFPFENEEWNGNWLDLPCISVTPDLEGKALSEKITEYWATPTKRVERFSGYLRQAKHFIDEIQQQPFDRPTASRASTEAHEGESEEKPEHQLIELLSQSERNKARYRLLTTELSFPSESRLKLKLVGGGDCHVVNPIAWLKQMLDDGSLVGWQSYDQRPCKTVLVHGDYHTGNLFLGTEGEHLTVLDYDRVGGGRPEEDLARLHASFVSFVFALEDFKEERNWEKYAPPALSLLAGFHPFSVEALENKAFARDLVETLGIIGPVRQCPYYAASVAQALLIQLKTTYTKADGADVQLSGNHDLLKNQGRNAATWLYLAFILRHLVADSGGAAEDWPNPFQSALPSV